MTASANADTQATILSAQEQLQRLAELRCRIQKALAAAESKAEGEAGADADPPTAIAPRSAKRDYRRILHSKTVVSAVRMLLTDRCRIPVGGHSCCCLSCRWICPTNFCGQFLVPAVARLSRWRRRWFCQA